MMKRHISGPMRLAKNKKGGGPFLFVEDTSYKFVKLNCYHFLQDHYSRYPSCEYGTKYGVNSHAFLYVF